MAHSMRRVWIHAVFSTKNKESLITPEIESSLYGHIVNYLQENFNCPVEVICGTEDHVHLLFMMNLNCSLAEMLGKIKGESSHWLNGSGLVKRRFEWATGYGAFSVSESGLQRVKHYIANQKEHHKTMGYMQEMEKIEQQYFYNKEIK